MHEHIFGLAEDICKAETFVLVEPFHAGRFQRQVAVSLCVAGVFLMQHQLGAGGRCDFDHLDRLLAARRPLHLDRDRGSIGHRALSEIPQHVGMQKNIAAPLVSEDESESLARIEPFHPALKGQDGFVFFFHVERYFPD
jgi:hypothetical protein